MSCCKYKISDLKHWITLKVRDIQGLSEGVSFSERFTEKPLDVAAKIKTLNQKIVFDGTGIEKIATHLFVIRYMEEVTNETWIEYKGVNYNILSFVDVDEENEWLEMNCEERGANTNVVNHA